MSRGKIRKRSIAIWILPAVTYLCFVAELAFIIMGFTSYGIVFAGLCFCLVIVFFVLWREERLHELLILQSSLDDALRREELGKAGRENGQVNRLRREKEDMAREREQVMKRLEELVQENETLAHLLDEAKLREEDTVTAEAAVSILPSDETPADLDLAAVSSQVTVEMEDSCREAGIRLRLSCPKEPLTYRADERYIRLILKNIIDNSIKYMRRSGTLVITLSNLGNSIFWAFKDDGMGLGQKETENIFDLNFQGSNRAGGNGLGLAQVKAIVSHYGGTVYARSTNGMGIYIQLPVSRKP